MGRTTAAPDGRRISPLRPRAAGQPGSDRAGRRPGTGVGAQPPLFRYDPFTPWSSQRTASGRRARVRRPVVGRAVARRSDRATRPARVPGGWRPSWSGRGESSPSGADQPIGSPVTMVANPQRRQSRPRCDSRRRTSGSGSRISRSGLRRRDGCVDVSTDDRLIDSPISRIRANPRDPQLSTGVGAKARIPALERWNRVVHSATVLLGPTRQEGVGARGPFCPAVAGI